MPVGRAGGDSRDSRDGSLEPGGGAARRRPRSGEAADSPISSDPAAARPRTRTGAGAGTGTGPAVGSRRCPGGGPVPVRGASDVGKRAWARDLTADDGAVCGTGDAVDEAGTGPFPGRKRCRR
ncbi:hypothetical protein SSP531S_15060 [Streptomyces spongiicola]|uniref:Uncharacterized protein n=1 Tax=Streptomyces spongiicola TaxID=1690221 RepID=A0A388SUQ5_9ACTN|nr:hypothetical protein SSP531S_15060 [Streptomyces spongiicola]